MIEGIKVDFTSEELIDHLVGRAEYHADKAERYQTRIDNLKGIDEAEKQELHANSISGNPIDTLESKRKDHIEQAGYFRLLAEHVVADETYRLEKSDLRSLEFTQRHW